MIGENIADEIDCGNFFDHIDDLLDFPTEDLDDAVFTTNAAAFPPIWSAHSDSLPPAVVDPVFSADTGDSGLSAELPAPVSFLNFQMPYFRNLLYKSLEFSNKKINK